MPGYTIVNLKELENRAVEGGSTEEARLARADIQSEHIGLSHFRYAPGRRSSKGTATASRRRSTSCSPGRGRSSWTTSAST